MGNPLRKLLGQTALYGLSSMLARLLNFLLVPMYTRLFAPDAYGVVTELYAYAAFFAVLLTFGFETAYFRFAKADENKVFASSTLAIWLASLLFFGLVAFNLEGISSSLGSRLRPEYILAFAGILGFDAMAAIPLARLRYQEKALWFALLRFGSIVLNICLNLYWLVWLPTGDVGADSIIFIFYANLIASGLLFLATLPHPKLFIRASFQTWKAMAVYSWPLWIGGFAGVINETLDRALLVHLLPSDIAEYEVGIYGACYKLAVFMTLFVQAFRLGVEPFYFQNEGKENAKENLAKVARYFFLAGCFIFLVITGLMDWFKYFIGEEYHVGLGVVPILLVANLCLGLYVNLSAWYKLSDQTRFGAFFSLVGALITLGVNFWGIQHYGYWASAYATLAAYGVMCILSYTIGQKRYAIPYPTRRMLIYAVWTGICFWVLNILPFASIINGFFGILLFLMGILLLEKDKLRNLRKLV